MIRVIVESPFAPRTPLPDGDRCVSGRDLDCPGVDHVGKIQYGDSYCLNWCAWCFATKVRAEESALHARYLAAALRDCVLRGETPYASHGLLTLPGVLRDEVPEERERGIRAGFAWREVAHGTAFYVDLGWSNGMSAGSKHAGDLKNQHLRESRPTFHWIEERTLGPDWDRK